LSHLALLNVLGGCFAFMPEAAAASVMLILFMTVGAVMGVATNTVLTVIVPNELRGLCFAVSFVVAATFGGCAPVLVSMLSSVLGGPTMIGEALTLLCVSASVVGAVIFALTRGFYAQQEVG
jgi:hypothetical protein